jgi:hypothetical protein
MSTRSTALLLQQLDHVCIDPARWESVVRKWRYWKVNMRSRQLLCVLLEAGHNAQKLCKVSGVVGVGCMLLKQHLRVPHPVAVVEHLVVQHVASCVNVLPGWQPVVVCLLCGPRGACRGWCNLTHWAWWRCACKCSGVW